MHSSDNVTLVHLFPGLSQTVCKMGLLIITSTIMSSVEIKNKSSWIVSYLFMLEITIFLFAFLVKQIRTMFGKKYTSNIWSGYRRLTTLFS